MIRNLHMPSSFNDLVFRQSELSDEDVSAARGYYNLLQQSATFKDVCFNHFGDSSELDGHQARLTKSCNANALNRSRNLYLPQRTAKAERTITDGQQSLRQRHTRKPSALSERKGVYVPCPWINDMVAIDRMHYHLLLAFQLFFLMLANSNYYL